MRALGLKRSGLGRAVVLLLVLSGCGGRKEHSDLLTLLGADPTVVHSLDQDVEHTYDALTLLSWAEAAYVSEDWVAAVLDYRRFLTLHPQHRMAAFAQYRLASSLDRQVSTPDRDPGAMQEALAAYETILSDFPQSLYADAARNRVAALTQKKAEHQSQVALFYYKRAAYPAAIARFKAVLALTDHEPLAPKALYYLSHAHHRLGHDNEAQEAMARLVEQYPHSDYAVKRVGRLPSP